MTPRRKVGIFAVAAAIGLAAMAYRVATYGGANGTPTADDRPTPAEDRLTEPEVRAEAMRLVGNLPGSDGTFAFWGDLAVVNHWEN